MKTLAEATSLFHRGGSHGRGLSEEDLRRVLSWAEAALSDLDRLHGKRLLHGDVCPAAIELSAKGAKLAPRGSVHAPREYRDPDRERLVLRDSRLAEQGEPRHDLFGLGASIFAAIDGGPPSCGGGSPFTRSVPRAVAFVVYRAMADGPGRYPTARLMRDDLRKLLRLAKRRRLEDVAPEDLPSFSGGSAPRVQTLHAFRAPPKRNWSAARAVVVLALAGAAGFLLLRKEVAVSAAPPRPAPAPDFRVHEPGLADRVAEWRDRLDTTLRASGEHLDPVDVPLLVISDLDPLPALPWPRHPSKSLADRVRTVLAEDVRPADVQAALLAALKSDTLPAVLWVTPGGMPGQARARLYYRGLAYDAVVKL
jgi:hypothetical protein